MLSYWEQKQFTTYDNIIVGAGLAGLFSAIFLKEKFPKERVLVISKGVISDGASTKNAGFACMGSITELEDDLNTSSVQEVVSLFDNRYNGLQIMRQVLGDENIGFRERGSYELLTSKDLGALDKIDLWNDRLSAVADKPAFSASSISTFQGFDGAIKNELEAEVDTGKLIFSLRQKAQQLGVELMTNTTVHYLNKKDSFHEISIDNNERLQAQRVFLCTNAFSNKLLGNELIVPARAQVIVTKPIKNIPFTGIYHFDRGYYYFREIDGRVLFGGGRQLDSKNETTTIQGQNEIILRDLEHKLNHSILPNLKVEIDYSWSGIMAKASSKKPISKQLDENLFLLAAFGGMGVALAPYMARELIRTI
jgi:glycine/D-amino acid oxidase-like deaminating enzyme